MTAATSLQDALELYRELMLVNKALIAIDAKATITGLILSGSAVSDFQVPLLNIAVPNSLRAALTSRQNNLTAQLAALGITF